MKYPMEIGDYEGSAKNLGKFWEWARLPKDGRVLDAGCGAGRNYIGLYEKSRENDLDVEVYGIDNEGYPDKDNKALARAKEELDKRGLPKRLVKGEIRQLPFADETFDAVYANAIPAKCSVDGWRDVMRVLRRGGKAYINLVQKVEHKDPLFKEDDWGHDTGEVKRWFESDNSQYSIEFIEHEPVEEKSEYRGLQDTAFLLVKIERLSEQPATPSGEQ